MRLNRFIREEAARTVPLGHNVCGVLVHAQLQRLPAARAGLSALPGVEVHQVADDGRMILTVEDADGVTAAQTLAQLNQIEGVVSAALVFHHCEPQDLSEEMPS
ncbi:MAG TPA: chaperone NapD [Azospirillaceae bacterium]|nr:chaperone NapD [Azospirillaceae bacterium]